MNEIVHYIPEWLEELSGAGVITIFSFGCRNYVSLKKWESRTFAVEEIKTFKITSWNFRLRVLHFNGEYQLSR